MTNITNVTGKYEQAYLGETGEKKEVAHSAGPTETAEAGRTQDDRVSLSDASKELQAAKDAVAATPDIRQQKVDAIKQAVENGSYELDPAKIAEKMLGSIIDEQV